VFTYREATSVDLQAICVIGQEFNALHHAAWPDVFAPPGDPERDESIWREMIGVPDATPLVAEPAERVIGFVNVAFIAKDTNPLLQPISYARVGSVGVAESRRGCGVGTELMRRAEAWAAAKGAKRISLNAILLRSRCYLRGYCGASPRFDRRRLARCHLPAQFGATTTGVSAFLAMLHIVLCAFFTAGLAHVGTYTAYRRYEVAVAGHVRRCQATDLRAIHIELDAARHHFRIVLRKTGDRTMIASIRTVVTGFNAFSELLMSHCHLLVR